MPRAEDVAKFVKAPPDVLANTADLLACGLQGTIDFLRQYAAWWRNGEAPRLLPKNFTE